MDDSIKRQDAIDELKKHRDLFCDNTPESFSELAYGDKCRVDEIDNAIATLVNMPCSQRTGEWLDCEVVHDRKDAKITDWQQARCSICGRWHTTPYMYYWHHFEYCPNCGANMRGDKT